MAFSLFFLSFFLSALLDFLTFVASVASAAFFSVFFWMRRRTYCSSVWPFSAARVSYSTFSAGFSFASFFAIAFCSLSLAFDFDDFRDESFDFLLFLASFASFSSRLRLFFLSDVFAGASVSEAEVGGVLAPDEGFDASVVVAEESSMVPSIDSPFTKKPYKPPRLMPFVRIWSSVLCAENQH